MLFILVLIRCCCSCCCSDDEKVITHEWCLSSPCVCLLNKRKVCAVYLLLKVEMRSKTKTFLYLFQVILAKEKGDVLFFIFNLNNKVGSV